MAELHAFGVAAVLAADSDLQFRIRRAPALDPPLDKHANAVDVERLEWVILENAGLLFVNVVGQEATGVVAGKTHCRLRQVVGAEREEFRDLGNLIREQSGARQLNHRADQILDLRTFLLEYFIRHSMCGVRKDLKLFSIQNKRMHYLR